MQRYLERIYLFSMENRMVKLEEVRAHPFRVTAKTDNVLVRASKPADCPISLQTL